MCRPREARGLLHRGRGILLPYRRTRDRRSLRDKHRCGRQHNASLNQEQVLWDDNPAWDKNWRFAPVDIAEVARGFGCISKRTERPEDIKQALIDAIPADRTVVLDVVTDVAACSQPSWGPSGSVSLYAVAKADR
jgi:Thiamine pyrophosphate enzyme, C-terminal TPP binding domain